MLDSSIKLVANNKILKNYTTTIQRYDIQFCVHVRKLKTTMYLSDAIQGRNTD